MKFTSQICTSREQSERLLALGLKKETADMMFIALVKDFRGKDVPNAERVYSLCTWYEETSMGVGLEKREYIPAWSLHRLIEMMPSFIEVDDDPSGLEFKIAQGKLVLYKTIDDSIVFAWGHGNLYDSIISCIKQLIEEGYFNKEYLE